MKKQIKHLSALMVALIMALSLCVPAFATSTGVGDSADVTEGATATITVGVSNPDDAAANGGDTLNAYQVVAIAFDAATNTVSHTFSALFQAFQGDALGAAWNSLTPEAYGELSENDLKDLLGAFSAYIKGQTSAPAPQYTAVANESGVAKFENVAMGQYIILGGGSTNGAKIYQTVTAEVEPVQVEGKDKYQVYSNYTVAMKTSKPDVSKEIASGTKPDDKIDTGKLDGDKHDKHQQTASIGDKVAYKLNVNVPTYPAGATNTTFFVGDTLSKGLTLLQADPAITVKGIRAGTETVLTVDDAYWINVSEENGDPENPDKVTKTTLYVDFDYAKIAAYDSVAVEYSAELNEDADFGIVSGGNVNDVDLIYSNDPFNGNSYKPGDPDRPEVPENPDDPRNPGYGKDEDKEIVYTYGLVIDKYEEKQENEKLSGAEFEIYRNADGTDPILNSDGSIVTLVTDANGAAQYVGLEVGDYYLKETVAPTGYNKSDELIKITIDAGNIPFTKTTSTTVYHYTYTTNEAEATEAGQAKLNGLPVWMNDAGDVATGEAAPSADYRAAYVLTKTSTTETVISVDKGTPGSGYYKAGISNGSGMHLPSTGGMGTTIFYVVGSILVAGAAIALITRRRMHSK